MTLTAKQNPAAKVLKNWAIVGAMIIVYLMFAVMSANFRTAENTILIFRQVSVIAVMGCGMSFVIIGGNFDLSVGSLLSLCCCVCIDLHDKIGPIPAILITVVVGILSGAVCGFLVGYLRLNSMIITLGMMNVLQALALMYTGGSSVTLHDQSAWFGKIGKGSLGPIPYVTLIMIAVVIIYALLLTKTVFGHQVLTARLADSAASMIKALSLGHLFCPVFRFPLQRSCCVPAAARHRLPSDRATNLMLLPVLFLAVPA